MRSLKMHPAQVVKSPPMVGIGHSRKTNVVLLLQHMNSSGNLTHCVRNARSLKRTTSRFGQCKRKYVIGSNKWSKKSNVCENCDNRGMNQKSTTTSTASERRTIIPHSGWQEGPGFMDMVVTMIPMERFFLVLQCAQPAAKKRAKGRQRAFALGT